MPWARSLDLRLEFFDLLFESALLRLSSLEELNRLQEFFFQSFELLVWIRHVLLIADCRLNRLTSDLVRVHLDDEPRTYRTGPRYI